MTDLLGFSVFGVDWQFLKPFIVIGLAFGGVYALSGVGLVVLYRATGVLNLAFGAIGAAGALIAYYLLNHTSCPEWLAFSICVAFGGVVNLAYGMVFGPACARRDPLVKMMGTLALALILLGFMAWRAPAGGARSSAARSSAGTRRSASASRPCSPAARGPRCRPRAEWRRRCRRNSDRRRRSGRRDSTW